MIKNPKKRKNEQKKEDTHKMKKHILIILFGGTIAFSQYWEDVVETFYQIPSAGIRSHAMGDAFVAVSGDAFAMFHNPAGLSNIQFTEIQFGVGQNQFSTNAKLSGKSSVSTGNSTYLDGFLLTVPISPNSFAMGFGWSNPYRYLYTSKFTQEGSHFIYETSGAMQDLVLFGGFRLNENIQLGVGIHFIDGTNMYFGDEIYDGEHFIDQSDYEYSGVMANFGMIAKVTDFLDIGYTISTPRWISVNEYWSATDYDTASFSYEFKSAAQFKGGFRFYLENVELLAEIDISNPQQMNLDSGYLEDDIIENQALQNNLKPTMNLKFGGEVLIPFFNLKLRSGIQYLQTPYRENSEDRLLYSAGFGMLLDPKLEMNGAISRADWSQNQEDGVLEEYRFCRVALGMSFRF